MSHPDLLQAAAKRLAARALAWSRPAVAIVLADGRTLASSDPDRAGSLGCAAREVLSEFAGDWGEGDAAVANDPFAGGVHVCEFTLVRPLCADAGSGAIALRMRVPDVGGFEFGGLAPQSFDTWGEGARFPPLRIRHCGERRGEAVELITMNSRTPHVVRRSLDAMLHEADRLAAALRDPASLQQALHAAEARCAQSIARLTAGRCSVEAPVEIPGAALPVANVRLDASVAHGMLALDFSRSDAQVGAAVNSTVAHTLDCVLAALHDALGAPAGAAPAAALAVVPGDGRVTGAAPTSTTGLAPTLAARAIRCAVIQALAAFGAPEADPDNWWARAGRRRFDDEVDATTLRLHPARVAEARALEQAAAEGTA